MIGELQHLIAEARSLANDHPCVAFGHKWESEGGRACPLGWGDCSQTVYLCERCGTHDFGEKGGPAFAECNDRGFCKHLCEAPHFEQHPD